MNTLVRLLHSVCIVSCSIALIACSTSKKDPYVNMSAEKIYNQGKSSAKKERYAMAVKDFEALEARYPYGDYTCKAQLALIHAYYKKDEAASASAAADRFIRMYPNHKDIDYVYYLKGLINYDENYSTAYRYFPIERSLRDPTLARESFDNFKILLQRFPNSKYASDAKQRMIHLRNQLANHELYIAKHYLNKKAYIAAANRAGYIVNQFDQTEATPHALAIMVKAYQALGMEKLANDALVILNKNFPQYSVENLIKKIS